MTKNVGTEGWSQVEKRFLDLAVEGKLPKTRFGQCIGTSSFSHLLLSQLFSLLLYEKNQSYVLTM